MRGETKLVEQRSDFVQLFFVCSVHDAFSDGYRADMEPAYWCGRGLETWLAVVMAIADTIADSSMALASDSQKVEISNL